MRAHVHTYTHIYIYMEKEYWPQPQLLAQNSSGTNSNSPMDSLCYDPMIWPYVMTLCSDPILVLESRSKVEISASHQFHCSCIATVADRFPATRVSTLSFRMIAAPILIGRKQGTTTITFPVLLLTARGVRVVNTSPFYRLVAWHNRLCPLRTSLIFSTFTLTSDVNPYWEIGYSLQSVPLHWKEWSQRI